MASDSPEFTQPVEIMPANDFSRARLMAPVQ